MDRCLFPVLIGLLFSCARGLQRADEAPPPPPRFTVEPPGIVRFSNTSGAEIRCAAAGGRPVNWVGEDGTPAVPVQGLRSFRPADGALLIEPFSAAKFRADVHRATYRCLAADSLGATLLSRDVRVHAVVLQSFTVQLFDEFVTRDNVALLRCHVPASVQDYVTVSAWIRKDGEILTPGAFPSPEVPADELMLESGELVVFQPRTLQDYTCRTHNSLTDKPQDSTTSSKIILTDPHSSTTPRIIYISPQTRRTEGSYVTLGCVAQGHPAPTYTWHREHHGTLLPLSAGERLWIHRGVLAIRDVGASDAGRYVCLAANQLGEKRAQTYLTVTSDLKVRVTPELVSVDAGRSVTLNCSVEGYPVHSVSWLKDGHPLPPTGSRWSLHLPAVSPDLAGIYQCRAYNDHDSAQAAAFIRVGAVAPTLVSGFRARVVQPGQAVSLRCQFSGIPPGARVLWELDGTPVMGSGQRVRVEASGRLDITAARPEDGGLWACAVPPARHTARIDVPGPPFVRPMPNISAVSGANLVVPCPVGGYPLSAIAWSKGGIVLPLNKRQRVDASGVLSISDVDPLADHGEYACVVKNDQGQVASGTTFITVVATPVINSHILPETLRVDQGSRVKLMCAVLRGDGPLEFSWQKDGAGVSRDQVSVQQSEDSSILAIPHAGAHHAGRYTCQVSNRAASINRTTVLVVNVPPYFTVEPPENVSVVEGRDARLDCAAAGLPPPTITWKKAKGETEPSDFTYVYSSARVRQLSNGSLALHETVHGDRGFYLCQATNGVGADLSKMVLLTVHVPPRFTSAYRSQNARMGEKIALVCKVTGDRPLSISWQKNRHFLEKSSRYHTQDEGTTGSSLTSHLIIPSGTREDSGLYTCVAENPHGRDESNIQVVVQDVPSPPTNLSVTNVTSRSVSLQWEVPSTGNSPLTSHTVVYRCLKPRGPEEAAPVRVEYPGASTHATVPGLRPVTAYTLHVVSENVLGRSAPSPELNVTTAEEAPEEPPQDVLVQPTGAHSLKVLWKPPQAGARHGQLQGYYVGYRPAQAPEDSAGYQYKHVTGLETGATYLTNLRQATDYLVVVQAFNRAGPGPRSPPVQGRTLDTAPPTSPSLTVISSTTSSIYLSWDKEQNDKSVITEYVLHWRRAEGGQWSRRPITAPAARFNLTGLQCGSTYELYVTAANSLGTGEPGPAASARTLGAAPRSPPTEHFLAVTEPTSVTVNLSAWSGGGCPIREFSVAWRTRHSRRWSASSPGRVPGGGLHVVRGLAAGREYDLLVTAHSAAGDTQAEYEVRTPIAATPRSGSPVKTGEPEFFRNLALIVPVLASVGVVLVIVIVLVLCLRRHLHEGSSGYQTSKHCQDLVMSEKILTDPNASIYGTSPTKLARQHSFSKRVHHDYAEPYTAVPPPRRVCGEKNPNLQPIISPNNESSVFATIKRNPARSQQRPPSGNNQGYELQLDCPLQEGADKKSSHINRRLTR